MVAVVPSPHIDAADLVPAGRVLVIEDDPDIAELLSVCLSTSGLEVVVSDCRSAADIVAAVRHHRPHGVVMELPRPGAPEGDRFDRLRDHPTLRGVAIVATTSYPPGHRDVVLRACDALLAKPFSITELLDRLEAGMISVAEAALR